MVHKRHSGFDDEIEPVEQPYIPHLNVGDSRHELLQPTGLLGPTGRPILRYYPPSNPIGFLADLDEDADGETYEYVEAPFEQPPEEG